MIIMIIIMIAMIMIIIMITIRIPCLKAKYATGGRISHKIFSF